MKKCCLTLSITRWVRPGHGLTMPCKFSYDPRDPLAVTVTFKADDAWSVCWVIDRQLLADGLTARCGEGDVVIWPLCDQDGQSPSLCLRIGNTNTALFEIPAEPLGQRLEETYGLIAPGTELDGVNWDELLQLAE